MRFKLDRRRLGYVLAILILWAVGIWLILERVPGIYVSGVIVTMTYLTLSFDQRNRKSES